MTVETSQRTLPVAPGRHGHIHPENAATDAVARSGVGRAAVSVMAVLRTTPRRAQVLVGAVIVGALLAIGVPLASLVPLLALGGCVGMHVFMGHGISHGSAHAGRNGTTADHHGARTAAESDESATRGDA